MSVDPAGFQRRTKEFALRVIQFCAALPQGEAVRVITRQLLRSVTSSAANYRSACRARSKQDMLNKLGIVEEELDETMFWIELLNDAGFAHGTSSGHLMKEADEILSMIVASRKSLRARMDSIDNRQSTIDNR